MITKKLIFITTFFCFIFLIIYKIIFENEYDTKIKDKSEFVSNYYDNGKLKEEGHTINGNKFRGWKYYSSEGFLMLYEYYNFNGKAVFGRTYNEKMEVVKTEGQPLGDIIFDESIKKNDDTLYFKVDDTLKLNLFMAYPPNCKVVVTLGGVGGDMDDCCFFKEYEIVKDKFYTNFKLDKKSYDRVFILYVITEIHDTINNSMYKHENYSDLYYKVE